MREAHREYPTLKHVWVDGVYNGRVIDNLEAETRLTIEMVKRSDDMHGFVVLSKRWVVERTFGFLCKYRLLSKEYERTLESSKPDILYAMTALMLLSENGSPPIATLSGDSRPISGDSNMENRPKVCDSCDSNMTRPSRREELVATLMRVQMAAMECGDVEAAKVVHEAVGTLMHR